MIPVTKPFLPPIQEYEKYLQGIWTRNWLTNNGPLVNELELALKDYLKIKHLPTIGPIKELGYNSNPITVKVAIIVNDKTFDQRKISGFSRLCNKLPCTLNNA